MRTPASFHSTLRTNAGTADLGGLDGPSGCRRDLSNAHHQQAYFGVTPAQAAFTGLDAFRPGSGLKEVGLVGGVGYRWGARHTLTVGLTVASLQGDARRSPLVRQRTAPGALFSLAYSL